MNKEQIIDRLKTIKYPGFDRNIVSFGMIKDITLDENKVVINLNISSQNSEKKEIVSKQIEKLLSPDFSEVQINILSDNPSFLNIEISCQYTSILYSEGKSVSDYPFQGGQRLEGMLAP